MTSDPGLALALATLARDAGCDIATLIHDLDETGACAVDCSGCALPDDPPPPNWCQWCGEGGHVIEVCADLAERRIRAACTCGCPSAWNGECMCGSLCPCDPCPYCDRNASPEAPWLAEVVADDAAPTVEIDKPLCWDEAGTGFEPPCAIHELNVELEAAGVRDWQFDPRDFFAGKEFYLNPIQPGLPLGTTGAGTVVYAVDEVQHFMLGGAAGYGKSSFGKSIVVRGQTPDDPFFPANDNES